MSATDRLRVVYQLSDQEALFAAIRGLDPVLRIAGVMPVDPSAQNALGFADVEMPEGTFDRWQSEIFDLPPTFAVSRAFMPIDRRDGDGTPGCTLVCVCFVQPISMFGLKHTLNVIGPQVEICDLAQFDERGWIATFAVWSPDTDVWLKHLRAVDQVQHVEASLQFGTPS